MKKKILVVDDERSIVRLLSLRLRSQNYDVIEAYDGYQCVEVAQAELPDLILLDIKMPNGGGVSAFEKMKTLEETKAIPVIFITAYPKPEIKDLVLEMGAAGFITKPFNGDEINTKVKSLLSKGINNKESVKSPENKPGLGIKHSDGIGLNFN